VKAGTPIGLVGSTGSSTGAHLHFEIRDRQDRPLNPSLFLDRKFATSDELPLRAALRTPRGTRVAFVSHIPASKRGLMQAKLDARTEGAAAANTSSGNLDRRRRRGGQGRRPPACADQYGFFSEGERGPSI
jgi:hypothetical protein